MRFGDTPHVEYVTLSEAARILGRSEGYLHGLVFTGKLTPVRKLGNAHLFSLASVHALKAELPSGFVSVITWKGQEAYYEGQRVIATKKIDQYYLNVWLDEADEPVKLGRSKRLYFDREESLERGK